jgi:hypothetical protein
VLLAYQRRALAGFAASVLAACVVLAATAASAAQIRRQEWWLRTLHVTQAWQSSKGSGVLIALLDTGVDPQQPDLRGSVITGPDYTGSGETIGSPYWGLNGTAMASLIAGHGHGPKAADGIIGIAPRARILSIRVTLESNDPLLTDPAIAAGLPNAIARGIRYAVRHHAEVIDLPLDPVTTPGAPGYGGSPVERAAVRYALHRHVVLVAPAGDGGQGSDPVNYPAAYRGVISVGAFDRHFVKAPFSSLQPYVTLTAAGVQMMAAQPTGYTTVSSTSAASAVVAGIVALIRAQFPHLTPHQVRAALTSSTVYHHPGGRQDGSGYGTVDAARALAAAARLAEAVPTHNPSPGPTSSVAGPPKAPKIRATPSGLGQFVRKDAGVAIAVFVILVAGIMGFGWLRRRRGRAARLAEIRAASRIPPRQAGRPSGAATGAPRTVGETAAATPGARTGRPEAGIPGVPGGPASGAGSAFPASAFPASAFPGEPVPAGQGAGAGRSFPGDSGGSVAAGQQPGADRVPPVIAGSSASAGLWGSGITSGLSEELDPWRPRPSGLGGPAFRSTVFSRSVGRATMAPGASGVTPETARASDAAGTVGGGANEAPDSAADPVAGMYPATEEAGTTHRTPRAADPAPTGLPGGASGPGQAAGGHGTAAVPLAVRRPGSSAPWAPASPVTAGGTDGGTDLFTAGGGPPRPPATPFTAAHAALPGAGRTLATHRPAPARPQRVSGTPPWGPADRPEGELPWALPPSAPEAPPASSALPVASPAARAVPGWPAGQPEPGAQPGGPVPGGPAQGGASTAGMGTATPAPLTAPPPLSAPLPTGQAAGLPARSRRLPAGTPGSAPMSVWDAIAAEEWPGGPRGSARMPAPTGGSPREQVEAVPTAAGGTPARGPDPAQPAAGATPEAPSHRRTQRGRGRDTGHSGEGQQGQHEVGVSTPEPAAGAGASSPTRTASVWNWNPADDTETFARVKPGTGGD